MLIMVSLSYEFLSIHYFSVISVKNNLMYSNRFCFIKLRLIYLIKSSFFNIYFFLSEGFFSFEAFSHRRSILRRGDHMVSDAPFRSRIFHDISLYYIIFHLPFFLYTSFYRFLYLIIFKYHFPYLIPFLMTPFSFVDHCTLYFLLFFFFADTRPIQHLICLCSSMRPPFLISLLSLALPSPSVSWEL